MGQIGASIAASLVGFEGFTVTGVDINEPTLVYGQEHKMADVMTRNLEEALESADVVFVCLFPTATVNFLKEKGHLFKKGTLVTDVCGIKGAVMEAAKELPDGVEFIGGHPMAGKERGGIENAEIGLFKNAHYIMVPSESASRESIDLLERLIDHIGFRDIIRAEPERHDAMVAFTSQLMHIIALSVCDDDMVSGCAGFEGNSFRGCTRVADIEADMWNELFTLNKDALCKVIKNLEHHLASYRQVLEADDSNHLKLKIEYSACRKRMHLAGIRWDLSE